MLGRAIRPEGVHSFDDGSLITNLPMASTALFKRSPPSSRFLFNSAWSAWLKSNVAWDTISRMERRVEIIAAVKFRRAAFTELTSSSVTTYAPELLREK